MKRATLGSFLTAAVLLFVVAAPAALAHTELVTTTPAQGAHLDAAPADVVLTFSEELLASAVEVSVVDDTGLAVRVGDPVVDGGVVTIAWPPGLSGTTFDVNYRVVSEDGHPVSGTLSFTAGSPASTVPSAASTSAASTATAAATPSAASSSTAATSDGSSSLALVAVAIGLAIAVAAGTLIVLRRRGGATP